jgi:hypothetical protein
MGCLTHIKSVIFNREARRKRKFEGRARLGKEAPSFAEPAESREEDEGEDEEEDEEEDVGREGPHITRLGRERGFWQ